MLQVVQSPPLFLPTPPPPPPPPFTLLHQHPTTRSLKATTTTAALRSRHIEVPLETLNPQAINRRLKLLARRNDLPLALSALDRLKVLGVPVNATAFSALLSACARSRHLPHAVLLHSHLRSNSLHRNSFLLNKLILAYVACGSPSHAHLVLASHPSPSSALPRNALLRAHVVVSPQWDPSTLQVFDQMRADDVPLNEYSFSCLLKSLSGSPSITHAAKAHALLIKNGLLVSSVRLPTALIDVYFRCCKVRRALQLFDEMPQRDVVTWGVMISGYVHNAMPKEALECASHMVSAGVELNSVVLASTLPAVGELGLRSLGRELHGFAMKRFGRVSGGAFVTSGLIDMYAKCGDITSARQVFYACKERNTVLWTAMISGYSSNSRLEQALRSVVWMQQEGVMPDVVTVATVLPVCAKLQALKSGKELHAYTLKHGFLPNISIATSLMIMYSSCRHVSYSLKVFDGLGRKNAIAWTAMMDSFLKNGCPSDALGIFRLMQLSKHRYNPVAMARGLSACVGLGAFLLGKEIHGQVLRREFEWVPFVSAEIINMYGVCGKVAMARRAFDRVYSKGVLIWTAIIDAYGSNELYKDALELFDQMVSDGYLPNRYTFDSMLAMCRKAGLPDEALRVYDLMVRQYNLKASRENYESISELLYIAGRHDEAQRFKKMCTLALD